MRLKDMINTKEKNLLQVNRLKKTFPVQGGIFQKTKKSVKAVDEVSLFILQGQTLGLVGESGCGKSTLARVILKLIPPDGGNILYKGQDIVPLPERNLKSFRQEVQLVFQDPHGSLNPKMTVGSTIKDGLRVMGLGKKYRSKRLDELIEMVGLPQQITKLYPHELSGGQCQRIGLARALSVNPQIIILDEPISALDVSIQAQIINLLQELQERLQISYLFISHDLNVVGYLSDFVAVMYLGQIVEYATSEELYTSSLHPYTQALLSATPQISTEFTDNQYYRLTGEIPDPTDPPGGCRFHTRCPYADSKCQNTTIPLFSLNNSHRVRCLKIA